MIPDQELMERIQAQENEAFEALYERYEAALRAHLLRIVRDPAAAEDLLQEVFLRVWTHASQWNGQGSLKSWLYRIGTNQALNYLRLIRRHPEQPLEQPPGAPNSEDPAPEETDLTPAWLVDTTSLGPEPAAELAEQREQMRRTAQSLPREKLEVLHLVHQQEMSIREAADELGISEGTVKSRLYYAKERLRHEWQSLDRE